VRLLRVRIARFWGEQELALELDPARGDDVGLVFVVGPNGSGKSRLLERLGRIFRQLSAGEPAGMDYDVEYELGDRRVLVTTQAPQLVDTRLLLKKSIREIGAYVLVAPLDSDAWHSEHVRGSLPEHHSEWLPARVVGVSSGPTSRLGLALERRVGVVESGPPDEALEAARLEADEARRRGSDTRCIALSGAELALAPLVLLSRAEPIAAESQLGRLLEIVAVEGLVAFAFDVPSAWRDRVGEDAAIFEELLDLADRVVELPRTVSAADDDDLPEPDLRAVFELRASQREQIEGFTAGPLILFDRLLDWLRRGVIGRVRLVLRRAGGEGLIGEHELSDGEFLLLGRYCLLILLQNEHGSLVLLDEPETHFNDRWKVDLVEQLIELLSGGSQRDEVLIATHSDLTLTDARPSEVYVIEDRQVQRPEVSPLAADRTRIAIGVLRAKPIGRRADRIVRDALRGSIEEMKESREEVGPGFPQSRLDYAVRKAERARDAP
jgi:predicted ATPase